MASIPVNMIVDLNDVLQLVINHAQVDYYDHETDITARGVHARGLAGNTSDVHETEVRFSDWHNEWTLPLVRLAEMRNMGAFRAHRD